MKKPFLLLAIVIFFAVISLALTGFHTTAHCYYKGNGVSISGCVDGIADDCPPSFGISGEESGVSFRMYCPWSMKSYITGYIGTALTLIFSVMICFIRKDSSPRNLIFTLTGLIVAALLAACGCMAYDLKQSFDAYDESDRPSGYTEQPPTFIANAAINFVLVFFVVWTAFKSKGDGKTPGNSRTVQAFGY